MSGGELLPSLVTPSQDSNWKLERDED